MRTTCIRITFTTTSTTAPRCSRGYEGAKQFPDKTYETLRVLEEGDLVAIQRKATFGDSLWSVIHIFRFDGDKIIEEWEASQQELKDSLNENGIF